MIASDFVNIMDDTSEGEVDIDKLDEPLLFSFVNKSLLEKFKYEFSDGENEDEDEDVVKKSPSNPIDDSSDDEDVVKDSPLDIIDDDSSDDEDDEDDEGDEDSESSDDEEDKEDEDSESSDDEDIEYIEPFSNDDEPYKDDETYSQYIKQQRKYDITKSDNWVQELFRNNNYELIDNEGGGDCFFAVVREAYKSIGKDVTVSDLRKILSREATEELFNNFKGMFNMFNEEALELKKKLTNLKKENKNNRKS
jgi:hypothetical protein